MRTKLLNGSKVKKHEHDFWYGDYQGDTCVICGKTRKEVIKLENIQRKKDAKKLKETIKLEHKELIKAIKSLNKIKNIKVKQELMDKFPELFTIKASIYNNKIENEFANTHFKISIFTVKGVEIHSTLFRNCGTIEIEDSSIIHSSLGYCDNLKVKTK